MSIRSLRPSDRYSLLYGFSSISLRLMSEKGGYEGYEVRLRPQPVAVRNVLYNITDSGIPCKLPVNALQKGRFSYFHCMTPLSLC